MSGIYILTDDRRRIKVGRSKNLPNRLSGIRQANPDRLHMIFFGEFGEVATKIEKQTLVLLRPWLIRGEWFTASPWLAGIAIEAAREPCPRRHAFIASEAAMQAAEYRPYDQIALQDQADLDFPELRARLLPPPPNFVIGLGGRKIPLPPTKYTRLIVEGFPEVAWGMPAMPLLVAARAKYIERQQKKNARQSSARRAET